jgi:hypothetical protein
VLAAVSPLFAVPMAPVLAFAGAVTLRRSSDPLTRGLAWGALLAGIVLVALIVIFVLGLLAVSAGTVVTEATVELVEGP